MSVRSRTRARQPVVLVFGEIVNDGDTVTVRIKRRVYSPVLRGADLPAETAVPWWGGRLLRFDFI